MLPGGSEGRRNKMRNNPLKVPRLLVLMSLGVLLTLLLGGNAPGSALAEARLQTSDDEWPDDLNSPQSRQLVSGFLSASQDASLVSPSSATSTPSVTVTPTPCTGWNVVSSPNVGSGDNHLFSSAAVGANDIWAVGSWIVGGSTQNTLTEHWDGSTWSVVPSPNMGATYNFLRTVVASASSDVWAIGGWGASGPVLQTLVEHWDGSTWSVVPSPNVGSFDNELLGEAMVSSDDIWAVGNYIQGNQARTLIEHWNGTDWSVVPSPNIGVYSNNFLAAAARAGNDVWAAGGACVASGCASAQALIEHWDGSSWSVVPSPSTGGRTTLFGLAARTGNDVWTVGRICLVVNCTIANSLIEHWDGSVWSIVPSPNPGSAYTAFHAVVAPAANDAWATGSYSDDDTTFALPTVHWDGTSWTYVPVPNAGSVDNDLNGFAAISPSDIWAVGDFDNGSGWRTQVQHYTGPCAAATPTPPQPSPTPTITIELTSTGTSTATSTATSTTLTLTPSPSSTTSPAPSSTAATVQPSQTLAVTVSATASPTRCSVEFSDVPPGSTFYSFVECLACKGILNGYADGTFHPGANVTRGQLCKIVSNSAGFDDAIPSDRQTFSDVPPSSTFWVWIERMVAHGAIGGYACGGPGEPCDPQNRPNFRPGADATRGQISKIVSEARGFTDAIPPTEQTYTDVPPTNTFWVWIERLSLHAVMSGYPCGGPNEPCDPQHRAYFRWYANATRGRRPR